MPELPDLQVFSQNLNKKLKDKKLKNITVEVAAKVNSAEKELNKLLGGQGLKEVVRAGKTLEFLFKNEHRLGMHLMLHGGLVLLKVDDAQPKYPIAALVFEDGTTLVLTDFQKAANITLDPERSEVPDALDVTEGYLFNLFSKKKSPVKTVLLDQKVLRGIGNAYADEILWDARISPASVASKIPKEKLKALIISIKTVLKNAEKQILKAEPDSISGEVRDFLQVHQPKKKTTASGAVIRQSTIGSRKTYFTDEQQLFG